MRKLRYWINLILTFFTKFKGLLAASAVFALVIFFFYSRLQGVFGFFERGEVVAVVDTLSLDNLPSVIQKEISMGLTTVDEEKNVQAGLATSWYTEDDGRTWVFRLGDYKWQDGESVTAGDINYKFTDAQAVVVDKKTIKFILKDPFTPFPSVVSKPVFKKGLVGIGEWKLAKLSTISAQFTQSLRLTNIKTGKIRTYKFYPSQEAARTAFKLGEVAKIVNLTDPKDLIDWKNAKVFSESHEERYVAIFFNTQDATLSEKEIRQALAYSIRKDDFQEKKAIGPIAPSSWASNPQVKQYQYSQDRAKELLASYRKKIGSGDKTTINLVTIPGLLSVADKIKVFWETVGVETHIQVTNIQPQDFQAFLVTTESPPDPDQYTLWHSKQTQNKNLTRLDNPRIDKLLEDGRRTLNQEERKKIYLDFQRFLMEETPFIPLFHPETYTISRK